MLVVDIDFLIQIDLNDNQKIMNKKLILFLKQGFKKVRQIKKLKHETINYLNLQKSTNPLEENKFQQRISQSQYSYDSFFFKYRYIQKNRDINITIVNQLKKINKVNINNVDDLVESIKLLTPFFYVPQISKIFDQIEDIIFQMQSSFNIKDLNQIYRLFIVHKIKNQNIEKLKKIDENLIPKTLKSGSKILLTQMSRTMQIYYFHKINLNIDKKIEMFKQYNNDLIKFYSDIYLIKELNPRRSNQEKNLQNFKKLKKIDIITFRMYTSLKQNTKTLKEQQNLFILFFKKIQQYDKINQKNSSQLFEVCLNQNNNKIVHKELNILALRYFDTFNSQQFNTWPIQVQHNFVKFLINIDLMKDFQSKYQTHFKNEEFKKLYFQYINLHQVIDARTIFKLFHVYKQDDQKNFYYNKFLNFVYNQHSNTFKIVTNIEIVEKNISVNYGSQQFIMKNISFFKLYQPFLKKPNTVIFSIYYQCCRVYAAFENKIQLLMFFMEYLNNIKIRKQHSYILLSKCSLSIQNKILVLNNYITKQTYLQKFIENVFNEVKTKIQNCENKDKFLLLCGPQFNLQNHEFKFSGQNKQQNMNLAKLINIYTPFSIKRKFANILAPKINKSYEKQQLIVLLNKLNIDQIKMKCCLLLVDHLNQESFADMIPFFIKSNMKPPLKKYQFLQNVQPTLTNLFRIEKYLRFLNHFGISNIKIKNLDKFTKRLLQRDQTYLLKQLLIHFIFTNTIHIYQPLLIQIFQSIQNIKQPNFNDDKFYMALLNLKYIFNFSIQIKNMIKQKLCDFDQNIVRYHEYVQSFTSILRTLQIDYKRKIQLSQQISVDYQITLPQKMIFVSIVGEKQSCFNIQTNNRQPIGKFKLYVKLVYKFCEKRQVIVVDKYQFVKLPSEIDRFQYLSKRFSKN